MPRCTQKDEGLMVQLLDEVFNMETEVVNRGDLVKEISSMDSELRMSLYRSKDISFEYKRLLRGEPK